MIDLVPDRLDELLTRSAMAKQSGVASTTLANWTARDHTPLMTVQAPSGDTMYTWRHLLDFCRAHPKLHATRQVLEQYRERFADDPSSHPHQRSTPVEGSTASRSQSTRESPFRGDVATLRSTLQDLKTQIDDSSALVAAAVKLAEEATSLQQKLVSGIVLLEAAVAAVPPSGG